MPEQEEPLISFEAVTFLAGIAASLMSVNQSASDQTLDDDTSLKSAVNFFIGISLACFGSIVVSRIITKVEIAISDPPLISLVEVYTLVLGLISLIIATMTLCYLIDTNSGYSVIAGGIVILAITFVAHAVKKENLTKFQRTNATTVVELSNNSLHTPGSEKSGEEKAGL